MAALYKIIMNTNKFVEDLIFTGNIVQDSDESVPWPERENRFNRYIELLDSVTGNEGVDIASAIIKSMQAEDDYGAYQTAQGALGQFPSKVYVEAMISELPNLIKKNREWAGELLCGLANSEGTEYSEVLSIFNNALVNSPHKESILSFVRFQETDGWLEHRVGVLGPTDV